MKPESSRRRFQYSMWHLWVLMTLLAIMFGVPGFVLLFLAVSTWVLGALLIVFLLVLIQVPAYFVLRSYARNSPPVDD